MPGRPQHRRARALRRDATDAERLLWTALRGRQALFKFRRQHPIPPFTVDFACVEARLVVEVDGGQHGGAVDAARDAALVAAGWLVRRYWNSEVIDNIEGVLADIVAVAMRPTRR
jgi:primosomal protein N' (replication factor Y)